MISVREEIEHEIWWQLKSGNVIFWFDNWTKLGALYFLEDDIRGEGEIEVKEFIRNEEWDRRKLLLFISEEMTDHITTNISPTLVENGNDSIWWMGM